MTTVYVARVEYISTGFHNSIKYRNMRQQSDKMWSKWLKKSWNVAECNVKAVTAELSVYSHFVWQPGVRRQGDFKRYFRPNEEDEMSVISTLMLANWYDIYSETNYT